MKKKKKKATVVFEMAYASSLGIALVIAIFGSLLLGVFIDRKLGTGSIFTILFLVIGIIAGFRNYYIFIKRYLSDEAEESGELREDEADSKKRIAEKNRDG
ncbi:MAG: AtpZ/AtpI family protein [Deltaproteobacteria bacterium]|nr:AtpZ/AtpI family protein [Deltaproteobacteria bacterium]